MNDSSTAILSGRRPYQRVADCRTDLPNLKQDAGFAPVRSVFSRTVAGQRTMHLRLTGRHPSGIGDLPNGTFKIGHYLEV